jgi:hypothetical protein
MLAAAAAIGQHGLTHHPDRLPDISCCQSAWLVKITTQPTLVLTFNDNNNNNLATLPRQPPRTHSIVGPRAGRLAGAPAQSKARRQPRGCRSSPLGPNNRLAAKVRQQQQLKQWLTTTTTSQPAGNDSEPKLEVCREFLRNNCRRTADSCRFAHPLASQLAAASRRQLEFGHQPAAPGAPQFVPVCKDFLHGNCSRADAQCR